MNAKKSILIYRGAAFSWIRYEGKGSFQNSPSLKKWASDEVDGGANCLAVDLAACTGMDSTFMGVLASISSLLASKPKGCLQIIEPGEKNKKSLEGLGLDVLMDIDPDEPVWGEDINAIREKLKPYEHANLKPASAPEVLEAHEKLVEVDSKNKDEFEDLIGLLSAELKAKGKKK